MSETDDPTWGVAVELSGDHQGVLRFAAHLAGPDDTVVGVHVMPDLERLHPLISREQVRALRQQILDDVARMLERHGVEGPTRVQTIENDDPALGLIELAEREPFDALIVGRRARRDDDPLVRLGQVCRRVLRKLPGPVIVVPPDFGEGDDAVEPGPVILATELDEHGASAAAFAKRLAARLDRPLLVANGIAAFTWGVSYLPAETLEIMLEQSRSRAGAALHAWVVEHDLEGAQEHVFMGDPARNLAQLAKDRHAAALVTGSRKLGPIERIFMASISTELAASAGCPTAIVPG